ncbi:MAG: amino acid permease [Planctomycetia bacterium]|nr:amino acid permease [Planctomycetia bacterium]
MSQTPNHQQSLTDAGAKTAPAAAGIGLTTGTLLIVANMIGVGVFTTTGYMVAALQSPLAILAAWAIGGVAAFCGALAYAELGAALPRNGGEYQLLSRIYHPAFGFTAGWVSLVVGFAAPQALFSMTFGDYLSQLLFGDAAPLPSWNPPLVFGLLLMALLSVMHSVHIGTGSRAHNLFTLGKVLLIAGFIVGGLIWGNLSQVTAAGEQSAVSAIKSPIFAVELVFVSFAYTGWNTAAYLAGEFRRPSRDIPWSVLAGTAIVTVLYLGLNVVFLASGPLADLASAKKKVGHVAAANLFGSSAGRFVSWMIVIGLISTLSANIMAGPRVYEAMGRDYPLLRFLAVRRAGGGPVVAILLQALVAAVMIVTASFETLLAYVTVTLSLIASLTVLGVLVLRYREPGLARPYRTWGYPVTPLVFLALEGWMIIQLIRNSQMIARAGAGEVIVASAVTLASGFVLYYLVRPKTARP